jgi:hypothetical protein
MSNWQCRIFGYWNENDLRVHHLRSSELCMPQWVECYFGLFIQTLAKLVHRSVREIYEMDNDEMISAVFEYGELRWWITPTMTKSSVSSLDNRMHQPRDESPNCHHILLIANAHFLFVINSLPRRMTDLVDRGKICRPFVEKQHDRIHEQYASLYWNWSSQFLICWCQSISYQIFFSFISSKYHDILSMSHKVRSARLPPLNVPKSCKAWR